MSIEGVILTPLKIIEVPKGNVFHILKATDPTFVGFGEAYFSTILQGEIKGWKQHKHMTLNLVVPIGKVKFVVHDNRPTSRTKGEFREYILSLENYQRLTILPGIWFGFEGLGQNTSCILNIADRVHDPEEVLSKDIFSIDYSW